MNDIYDKIVPQLNHLYLNFFTVQKMLFSHSGRKQHNDYHQLHLDAMNNFEKAHELFERYKDTTGLNPDLLDAMDALNEATNWMAVYLGDKANEMSGFSNDERSYGSFNELYKASRRLEKAAKKIS